MTILVGVHIAICIFLVLVILLQAGKGDIGINFGSSSQSIFGSKGAGNFLTRTTSICAVVYLGTSLFLTRCTVQVPNKSVLDSQPVGESPTTPTPQADKKAEPTEQKKNTEGTKK